jgi:hypothetical protein
MIGAIRAELLRSLSGRTVLGAIALTVLVPNMVLTSSGDPAALARDLAPGAATPLLVAPLAWSFVAAGFVGAYTVTREDYYHSLDRTLLIVGRTRAQIAKTVGGCVTAVLFAVGMGLAWCAVVAVILAVNGSSFEVSPAVVQTIAGSLLGAALGAAGGCAIGWVVRNYYAAAGVVLVVPLAFELMLLGQHPELARFMPGLTIAAISAPGYRDALLDRPLAILLSLAWVGAAGAVAFVWRRRA